MSLDQTMRHSVYFGDGTLFEHGSPNKKGLIRGINTWEDWHLIPVSRPEIVTPEVYTNYVDLPGSHGKLDLSEYLTGGPVYKNRSGSLEFYAANGYGYWQERYNQMSNFLHGKRLTMVLYDEPEYFYTGRFRVPKWESDGSSNYSTVSIDYELDPFKFPLPRASLDEYWNRFLMEDIQTYECMYRIRANLRPTFTIPGYTNGFFMDAFIDDRSDFPASVRVTLNDNVLTVTRASANSPNVKSGSIYPVTGTTNEISIIGTGFVNLIFFGGHL